MVALAPASLPMNRSSVYRGTSATPLAVPPSLLLHQINRTLPFTGGRRSTIALLAFPLLLFCNINNDIARAVEEDKKNESQLDEERVVRIFQDASPSVVSIKDVELQPRRRQQEGPNPLASPSENGDDLGETKIEGTGSGFVWDKKGHIVTNYHVVAKFATDISGLRRCKVFLEDLNGNRFARDGKLVGYDPGYDLAVLKVDVEGDKLRPALIGTSHGLRVGQSCFAIGNPYGYEHTLTTGVVSGLGRDIPSPDGRKIRGAIQTDADINAGNSGGPLIDSYGHVIGVNTATFTRKGTGISSGVNFAIPIDIVVQTIPSLIVYGTSVTNRF